jgi:hypothetical protein
MIPSTPNTAFRPSELTLPADMPGDTQQFNSKWTVLMEQCWDEVPDERPLFSEMPAIIRRISGGRSVNVL